MREIKKRWLFLLLCLLGACIPASCGTGDGEDLPPEPEEGVLIYAALNPVSSETLDFVKKFNEAHPDVQIEIHDYSDEGGIERLRVELVLGQVPDIMEMHYFGKNGPTVGAAERDYHGKPGKTSNFNITPGSYTGAEDEYFMPYRQMAQRGYLEDLWPYIENDPELGRDGVLQAPLKAVEVNGGLYMLFQRVVIFTLTGRESVVGARYSWTLEDVMEVYAGMPENSTIMRHDMTRRDVYFNLLCNSLERFVDRGTGECAFDSKGFRDLVGFLETFPDEVEYEKSRDAEEETIQAIKNGRQMLEGMQIGWPREIGFSDAIWQERASFVGYPTADGSSGSFFYATGHKLAMSSTCRNKEAAWDFIRDLIKPRLKREALVPFTDIPINLYDYEKLGRGELSEAERLARDFPEDPTRYFPTRQHFAIVELPLMNLLTEEDIQRHRDLVDHTTQLYWPEDELSGIVWETLGAYFAGDRTLDDTIGLLNNRVGLYLNEQK